MVSCLKKQKKGGLGMGVFDRFLHRDETARDNLRQEIIELNKSIAAKKAQADQYDKTIAEMKQMIGEYEGYVQMEEFGIQYVPKFSNMTALDKEIQTTQKTLALKIKTGHIYNIVSQYTLNGSLKDGAKMQTAFAENLIMIFNGYVESKKKAVTQQNINKTLELIDKKAQGLNRRGKVMGVEIDYEYINIHKRLVKLSLEKKILVKQEKERIKAEKEKLREQEKLIAEAEKAKAQLQKERRMYEQSLAKALTEQERQEFEDKLREIDKREQDIDYRINNSRAGYLYIVSTPAMPGILKLGATRRLNPLVRVQELSSASTPFPFVCHGLVFSDDVFTLETQVHNYFDTKRTNKENKHKEFFNITPNEAIQVLENEFNCQVHFVSIDEQEDDD